MLANQEYIHVSRYARWLEALKRREPDWAASVDRYFDFMLDTFGPDIVTPYFKRLGKQMAKDMEVVPSMRAVWAAGEVARNNHVTLYNCSFMVMNDVQAFSELLFILMCGTGVGFSVEQEFVSQLPELKTPTDIQFTYIYVEDSREGWAKALDVLLRALWKGDDVSWDVTKVRPRGAKLKTMGGRASGPEPLIRLFEFCVKLFKDRRAKGLRRLEPIDVLDICNVIADVVVVGGVRRSSELSLSDLNDRRIAEAKMGEFWKHSPHRSMSNNSAVYKHKPDVVTFGEEFLTLIKSQAGERGIFNREGAMKQMTANGRRKEFHIVGTNPCGEILLRDMEFCNLSEVIVRADDDLESLRQKVKVAAMFGAWQATFTRFPYLRPQWAVNCEEERLLGVSLTGIMDNPVLNNVNDKMKKWLGELKATVVNETEKWCKRLNINMSAAITCVKPSGTVSQLVNCASGIHPRYAQFYIRRYRNSASDPVFHLLRDAGVPWHPETSEVDPQNPNTVVLEFPVAAPKGCLTRKDVTALQQLEHWRVVKEFWCEHNPSITVYVDESEWLDVQAWCYRNFDDLVGISFLPKDNNIYPLAPYEEISEEKFNELNAKFPKIDYNQLAKYEQEDNTQGSQSYACTGDKCEIA